MDNLDIALIAILALAVLYAAYYLGRYHGSKEVEEQYLNDSFND